MKHIILIFSIFLISINGYSQSEGLKRQFVRSVFRDFKKNRLEAVTDKFVDSLFIDNVLDLMQEKQPNLAKFLKKEKVQKKRKTAKKRLLKSLEKAYARLDQTPGGIRRAKLVDMKFSDLKGDRSKTIRIFSALMRIEIEEVVAELRFPELTYDHPSGLFFILGDKVRLKFIDPKMEYYKDKVKEVELKEIEDVEEIKAPRVRIPRPVTERVREELVVDEDVEMVAPPVAEPAPKQEVYQVTEQMPEFPGGQKAMYKFINRNIRYPKKAKENGVEGRVYVRFIVGKDGAIRDVKILKGIGSGCDAEAIRVVKRMPKWKPGRQRGRAVSVKFTLPFSFKLKT